MRTRNQNQISYTNRKQNQAALGPNQFDGTRVHAAWFETGKPREKPRVEWSAIGQNPDANVWRRLELKKTSVVFFNRAY